MSILKSIRLLVVGVLTLAAATVMAVSPKVITYQGRLTDAAGNPVADGPYTVDFRLYEVPAGGTLLWSEPGVSVTTEKGLFTTNLGSPTPFPSVSVGFDFYGPDYIFRNYAELWLEIEVSGTTLAPRTKLQSVPYAMVSNGVSGASSAYPGVGVDLNPEFATLRTTGHLGEERVRLWGPRWGELHLYDAGAFDALTSEVTAYLTASFNSGGTLELSNNVGSLTIQLNGGAPGDNSAILPIDAVHSREILNEPGIAISKRTVSLGLFPSGISQNILSVVITIPSAGYIILDGYAYMYHNSGPGCFGWVQISETSGAPPGGNYVMTGSGYSSNPGGYNYQIAAVKHTVFKGGPGAYTFYLQGNAHVSNSGGTSVQVYPPTWLQATYFPTSYGSVASVSLVPPADNPDVEAVTVTDPMTKQMTTSYTVDLRYYELQANKAEAEALKAQLALQKARAAAGIPAAGAPSQLIDQK